MDENIVDRDQLAACKSADLNSHNFRAYAPQRGSI